jgi:hypothetical protein
VFSLSSQRVVPIRTDAEIADQQSRAALNAAEWEDKGCLRPSIVSLKASFGPEIDGLVAFLERSQPDTSKYTDSPFPITHPEYGTLNDGGQRGSITISRRYLECLGVTPKIKTTAGNSGR